MTLTLAQAPAPAVTPGAPTTTQTFPYTPLAANNLVNMIVNAQTASRVLNSVASSGVSWHIGSGTPVALNTSNHLYVVGGVVTAPGLQTVTLTFSGTPATVTVGIAEFLPVIPGLISWTFVTFTTNNGTSANIITTALTGGQTNDAFTANVFSANAPTGNSNAQGYLTYDLVNEVVYGQLPTAATVPATGFTATSGLFYINALLYRPTISLPPTKIPQMVSPYQGMF